MNVVFITSFQGRLLECDGGGGANWRRGPYWKKHVLPGALIGDGALIGYRALIRIFTVSTMKMPTPFKILNLQYFSRLWTWSLMWVHLCSRRVHSWVCPQMYWIWRNPNYPGLAATTHWGNKQQIPEDNSIWKHNCKQYHVIGVRLFSQSAPEKTDKRKSPQTFAQLVNFSKNVSAMFDNQTILLFWL